MRKTRVRLRDVADKTGFSANTVSLALRESPRIPEATRTLIQKAAADLDYTPNRIAQSLVSQESMTVGLVLTDIRNPILTQVAQEIARGLSEHGYATLFATSDNTMAREIEAIQTFRQRQVDGILIYPTDHRDIDHVRLLRERGYPVVSLVADREKAIDTVSVDEHLGAWKATRHLLEIGRRRIAFLDSAAPLGNTEKQDGYMQALAESPISPDPELRLAVPGHGIEDGFRATASLWARGLRPDAIIATTDSVALGVQRWCEAAGLAIPDDVAIAGFDDIEFARLSSVPISTVAYPVGQIADTAIGRLVELMQAAGPLPAPAEHLLDPRLIVRQSTAGADVAEPD
ncbi:LacI family DNA-binding transcriptional regulator [Bauldia sp.]|uniref:LacI family DNA-binding transcriptional regulator n=1 Tax=Bauldia sp. TaxID=2575872 RepID=UPI003BACA360